MDTEQIRHRLDRIAEKTEDRVDLARWWDDERVRAENQRDRDDATSGRLAWASAHDDAVAGLAALDRGDLELAATCLRIAEDHYVAALEARMTAKDYDDLATGAKPRGRHKGTANPERDRRTADAVAEQRALGRTGSEAIAAARRKNPMLMDENDDVVRAAIRRAEKKT